MGKILSFIGLTFVILLLVTIGILVSALVGMSQQCPEGTASKRTETMISATLEKGYGVITDSEATTLIKKSLDEKLEDPRICFTEGFVNLSGKVKLFSLRPSFFLSGAIDTNSQPPVVSDLSLKIGSMPNLPVISTKINDLIKAAINENLKNIKLNKNYKIEFREGSAKLSY